MIAHNEICRLPYTGISVGWGWGEEDAGGGAYYMPFKYDTPTPAGTTASSTTTSTTSMILTTAAGSTRWATWRAR